MIDTENGPTLYAITGDIKDANTLLVNRAQLRQLLPWRRKLALCWRNWTRTGRFALSL